MKNVIVSKEHMKEITKEDFLLQPEITVAITKLLTPKQTTSFGLPLYDLTHKDLAEILEIGLQNQLTLNEFLDAISEARKMSYQPMLILGKETAVTLKALSEATGVDFYTIFYYGLNHYYRRLAEEKDLRAKMDVIYNRVKKDFDKFSK